MKNGDISNVPAHAVACNLQAVCDPPSLGLMHTWFNMMPKLVEPHSHAVRGIDLMIRAGYNVLLFVETPELFHWAEVMINKQRLNFSLAVVVTNQTHFMLVDNMYHIEATLWVGEADAPFIAPEVLRYKDSTGWFAMYDYIKALR